MLNRVATLASSMSQLYHLNGAKSKVLETSRQVDSQKKSHQYAGISTDSSRLLALERLISEHQNFIEKNRLLEVRLELTDLAYEAAEKTARDLLRMIEEYDENETVGIRELKILQRFAFSSLKTMAASLNSAADGAYLFAGTKVRTPPVIFSERSMEEFQEKYDGYDVTYPKTRDSHLTDVTLSADADGEEEWLVFSQADNTITSSTGSFSNFAPGAVFKVSGTANNDGTYVVGSVSDDGTTITLAKTFVTSADNSGVTITYDQKITLTDTNFDEISFTAPNILETSKADSLSKIGVGDTIRIAGAADAANNGTYLVTGNNGTRLTVEMVLLEDEGAESPDPGVVPRDGVIGTVSAVSWYRGDDEGNKHHVAHDLDVDMDVNASHPAFEKIIRAIGIITQGKIETIGGLDQNTERLKMAVHLLRSALDGMVGNERFVEPQDIGDIEELRYELTFKRTLILDTQKRFEAIDTVLVTEQINVENVDLTDTIAKLMQQRKGLEASYNAFVKVQQLSLSDYLT